MAREISYTLQIGTRFDGGSPLIWSMLADDTLDTRNVVVPRPKHYRDLLARHAAGFDGTPASRDAVNAVLGLDQRDPDRDLRVVLRITDLMEPAPRFCPAGDWFYEIGPRAAGYAGVFAPAPVTFVISLREPAAMLAQAWVSGRYPGIEVIAPDPFALHWAGVLRALRRHCPEVPIIAWTAEEAPMVWHRVIKAATQSGTEFSEDARLHVARVMMNEEGGARLADYLESHPDMPEALRARVVAIYLNRFAREDDSQTGDVIPGWGPDAQARMDAHYAADLEAVAQIDGVTLIRL